MEEIIRKMKKEDFETIIKIFSETDFGCVGMKEIYKPGKQEQMMMMREILRGDTTDEKILVIEKLGKIVGYAFIQENSDTWHIGELAIASSYRRKGIGKRFMKKLQEMAIKCKKNISLECYEKDNLFFLKQGFQKVQEDDILTQYKWDYQNEIEKEELEK